MKKNIAILISGRGSNMQHLVNLSKDDDCPFRVALVVCNVANAEGLTWAKQKGLPTYVMNYKGQDKEYVESNLTDILDEQNIEFVILAGFMKLLGKTFVRKWQGKMVNIHPSLLPAYRGLHTHQRVLDDHVLFAGCTVHFVVEDVDAGPVIGQAVLPISHGDSAETLASKLLPWEHELLGRAVKAVVENKVTWTDDELVRTQAVQEYLQIVATNK